VTHGDERLPGIHVLEQTPIIIEKILHGADDELMRWKPAADRWSIGEVLGHLAEVEVVGFRERVQKMLEADTPRVESYDQNAAYASGRYSAKKARENLHLFCHERDRSLSFLRYVPGHAVGRAAIHSTMGRFTIGNIMNEWAFHDLGHLRQIAELYRSHAFFPSIGPYQRYYTIHP
jgi:hypothetical protein